MFWNTTNQSLLCPTVLQPCNEYLKEYDRFFSWGFESGISNVDKMSDIPLSVLENMSKKRYGSFYPISTRTTFG